MQASDLLPSSNSANPAANARLARHAPFVKKGYSVYLQELYTSIESLKVQISISSENLERVYNEKELTSNDLMGKISQRRQDHVDFINARRKRGYNSDRECSLYEAGKKVDLLAQKLSLLDGCKEELNKIIKIYEESKKLYKSTQKENDNTFNIKVIRNFRYYLLGVLKEKLNPVVKDDFYAEVNIDNLTGFFRSLQDKLASERSYTELNIKQVQNNLSTTVFRGVVAITTLADLQRELSEKSLEYKSQIKSLKKSIVDQKLNLEERESQLKQAVVKMSIMPLEKIFDFTNVATITSVTLEFLKDRCCKPVSGSSCEKTEWMEKIATHFFSLRRLPPASKEVVHKADYHEILKIYVKLMLLQTNFKIVKTSSGSGGVFFLTVGGEKLFIYRPGKFSEPRVRNEFASCYVTDRLIRYAFVNTTDRDGKPLEGIITEVFNNEGSFNELLCLFLEDHLPVLEDDDDGSKSGQRLIEKFQSTQLLGIDFDLQPSYMRIWNKIDAESFIENLLYEVMCVNTDLNLGNMLIQKLDNGKLKIQFIDWEKCFPDKYPNDFIDFEINIPKYRKGSILDVPVPKKFKEFKDEWLEQKVNFLKNVMGLQELSINLFRAHCRFVRIAAEDALQVSLVYRIFTHLTDDRSTNLVSSWFKEVFAEQSGGEKDKWAAFDIKCRNMITESKK